MITAIVESLRVSVPRGITTLEAFRKWTQTNTFPRNARVWFLKGEVWVDMRNWHAPTPGVLKNVFTLPLTGLVKATKSGGVWAKHALLMNSDADLGCRPDFLYVSHEAFQAERVRRIEGTKEGFVELEGSPDMVLEIVSHASIRKDRVTLRDAYWEASISEYWLVDARKEPLVFEIMRHTAKGF